MPYKYIEDISLADVAFEAEGKTLEELFKESAMATENVMIKDLKEIQQTETREFSLKAETLEKLLFAFLEEIIYYKDAEMLIFNKFDLKITQDSPTLTCKATGTKLDHKTQTHLVDVKAVTWHHFSLRKTSKGWTAQVILDI